VDLHYEVELALIMGKRVKDLDAADEVGAMKAIEGTLCTSTDYSTNLMC
jgi:2-keto-4-pentenoate hydratase/2-oxohepta-3-ene-1,7-dioic acid hydratase in catechol pathway